MIQFDFELILGQPLQVRKCREDSEGWPWPEKCDGLWMGQCCGPYLLLAAIVKFVVSLSHGLQIDAKDRAT